MVRPLLLAGDCAKKGYHTSVIFVPGGVLVTGRCTACGDTMTSGEVALNKVQRERIERSVLSRYGTWPMRSVLRVGLLVASVALSALAIWLLLRR